MNDYVNIFKLLPSAPQDGKEKVEEALKEWLAECQESNTTPYIADIAKYSFSPDIVIVDKLNKLKLDKYLQFITDQQKSQLEKLGTDKGQGSVAKDILEHKHNLNQEGINPLEVKFVPDLNITNYQKTLLKILNEKNLLKNSAKAKKLAEKLLDDYAMDSGERFPSQKK